MEKIKLLIVDDHSVIREGLKFIFKAQKGFKFKLFESDSRETCLKLLENEEIDVVLLDINLGADDGIELAKEIVILNQHQKIIALTMHDEEYIIKEMMNAGAKGYLLKNTGGDELIRAINSVMNDEIYYSNKVAIALLQEDEPKKLGKIDEIKKSLTKREIEVLKYVVAEYTNDEISLKLQLSKRTIDGYRQNLLEKIAVKNTVGLVKFAIKANIVI